jgi:ferredoxin--NADP+ reductase
VDDTVGLPYKNGVYVTNPTKTGNDPDDSLFQAYDEKSGQVVEGVFLAGWARKASEGLVGIAKRDGDWCAEVISRYLTTKSSQSGATADQILSKLQGILRERKSKPVDLEGLKVLDTVEKAHAASPEAIGEFKFASNADMLAHIERGRA